MGRLTKSRRFEVLARDGFKCRYCGAGASSAVLEVDHVKPISAGGSDHIDNLAAACSTCNAGKTDRVMSPSGNGFSLSPDKRVERLKLRASARERGPARLKHELWCWEVDSLDELDDGRQLAYVWCETHQKYEWHSLYLDDIGSSLVINTDSGPVPF